MSIVGERKVINHLILPSRVCEAQRECDKWKEVWQRGFFFLQNSEWKRNEQQKITAAHLCNGWSGFGHVCL